MYRYIRISLGKVEYLFYLKHAFKLLDSSGLTYIQVELKLIFATVVLSSSEN